MLKDRPKKASSAVIFESYVLSCWKLHISTQLINSFPLTYSMQSCDLEKLSIPLEAHHKAQSSEIFVFPQKIKSCNFLSFGQSSWYCIFKRPRRSAFKRRMACRIPAKKSVGSHLFRGVPKPGCSDGLHGGIIESHNFFVLPPIWWNFTFELA